MTHDLEEAIALADEVVVLSAGPAAAWWRAIRCALERPRDLLDLRTTPAFVDLYRAIWAVLREEVIKSQRDGGAWPSVRPVRPVPPCCSGRSSLASRC